MHLIRRYTMRGAFGTDSTGDKKKIDIFHGRYDRGVRITKFQVFPSDPIFANAECVGKLSTADPDELGIANPNRVWNWADPTQIAWAYSEDTLQNHDFLDSENLVVEDLYVSLAAGASVEVGYLIEMELYELDDYQSTLAMVGNRSQG